MPTFPRRQPAPKKRKDCKDYRAYRKEVREDFNGYCAYCGVHESDWPHNQKNYALDHFVPWSKSHDNGFYNLRWCCHVCNRADGKGDKWPSVAEETQGKGFVDLCQDTWQTHYQILADGRLKGLTAKALYTIEVIGLNGEGYVKQRIEILRKSGSLFQRI